MMILLTMIIKELINYRYKKTNKEIHKTCSFEKEKMKEITELDFNPDIHCNLKINRLVCKANTDRG